MMPAEYLQLLSDPSAHRAALLAALAAGGVAAEEAGERGWRLTGVASRHALLQRLLPLARQEGAVIALRSGERPPRAVLFDLDSTLIACEFLDELAARCGRSAEIAPLTELTMQGAVPFGAGYVRRIALLAGTPLATADAAIAALPLTAGAEALLAGLRRQGVPTAIVTGGWARAGAAVQQRLGIDALFASELETAGGRMTGRLAGPLMDERAKVEAAARFCASCGCRLAEAAAVGDGANDLGMLAAAGCAVLFDARPQAPQAPRPQLDVLEPLFIPQDFPTKP